MAPNVLAGSSVTAYAEQAAARLISVGDQVRLAAGRHLSDLEHGHERGLRFDAEAAAQAVSFFAQLPHVKGEWARGGGRLVLAPWQEFIVGSLFGWVRADGARRFRTAYIEVARKNGKSSLGAGLGLRLAFFDREPGAEVYCAATKRDQAKIVWGDARQMVVQTPGLRERVRAYVGNLHSERTGSKFEPLGADADSMDGLNIHAAIVDELHAHPNRKIVDVIETATAARRQPLIVYLTTAGYDRHSVCWQTHQYAGNVLAGTLLDDTFFAYVAALDEGDEWTDEGCWSKANPNLGVSVKLDDLQRKRDRALQVPSEQQAFRRLHCNEWTESSSRWLSLADWDANAVAPEIAPGASCYGGLDLASTTDLAALVLDAPRDGVHHWLARFWLPAEKLRQRVDRDRVPYDVWAREGLITLTGGNVIDYDRIRADIADLAGRYRIRELAYDPWNASQLITQLQSEGLNCVPLRQGYPSLTAPTKELETLVLSRRIRHGGHAVLRWMAGNVVVEQDAAGNIKPSKARSTEKIDGIVAAIMALARAAANGQGESVYEHRGLLVL